MKTVLVTTIAAILLFSSNALGQVRLVGVRGTSKIKLISGRHTTTVDVEDVLPGNAPHIYKVLFTAAKGGFLYLVVNVRSQSPISDKNAPCGGDSPQSIFWIKVDTALKSHELNGQIYASCSYNYYDSKVRIRAHDLKVNYGRNRELLQMTYDNRRPDDGLVITRTAK